MGGYACKPNTGIKKTNKKTPNATRVIKSVKCAKKAQDRVPLNLIKIGANDDNRMWHRNHVCGSKSDMASYLMNSCSLRTSDLTSLNYDVPYLTFKDNKSFKSTGVL